MYTYYTETSHALVGTELTAWTSLLWLLCLAFLSACSCALTEFLLAVLIIFIAKWLVPTSLDLLLLLFQRLDTLPLLLRQPGLLRLCCLLLSILSPLLLFSCLGFCLFLCYLLSCFLLGLLVTF